jgi:poly(3-hydroxybutyrate) depolymerase
VNKSIWAAILIVGSAPFVATSTGCWISPKTAADIATILADIATVIAQGTGALDAVQRYGDSVITDANLKAKFDADVLRGRAGLDALAQLEQGAKSITQDQYDAAAQSFKTAWKEITDDLLGASSQETSGKLRATTFEMPKPMALTYKVR